MSRPLLAAIASALIALDESGGAPSPLLRDTTDIQRLIADRHGLQRAALGWSADALACEAVVLHDEVSRAMRRCVSSGGDDPRFAEAMGVIERYLEQAAETTRRSHTRATRRASAPP